ncbi:MAG: 5-formyltetrahydrofolate cyclo-ligase [Sneathiella sp.]|nr:5-formyltetrahydrofolate cyclo-ligase [Sneathiella sp.]
MHTIVERKKVDRKLASTVRATLIDANAAILAANNLFKSIDLPADAKISLYLPIGSEIETAPLFEGLKARNITTLLPVVEGKDRPLIFKEWAVGHPLDNGHFNVPVPIENAKNMAPTILLVPLLAFDANGYRLGYGGGFYDRTLEALRANSGCMAVGYAYAGQEVAQVTIDKFDQPLDWLVTEKEARKRL